MKTFIEQVMPPLLAEEIEFLRLRKSINSENRPIDNGTSSSITGEISESVVRAYLLMNGKMLTKPCVDHGIDYTYYSIGNPRHHTILQIKEIYRLSDDIKTKTNRGMFCFPFQSDGHVDSRKNTKDSIDIFYNTLITPYRTLIFEIPSSVIPISTTKKETQQLVGVKRTWLDRSYNYTGDPPKIVFGDYLVYESYQRPIMQRYPKFFQEKNTLSDFFES